MDYKDIPLPEERLDYGRKGKFIGVRFQRKRKADTRTVTRVVAVYVLPNNTQTFRPSSHGNEGTRL